MLRVIHEARPAWVIGENVSGLISMELDQVLADLELEGYAARAFHIGAVGVNAPHRRMRVWIVAHAGCLGQKEQEFQATGSIKPDSDAPDAESSHPTESGLEGKVREEQPRDGGRLAASGGGEQYSWDENWIEVATRFCRVDDGLPAWIHARRVQRLKALGNAIVPQVAYEIIKAIAAWNRRATRLDEKERKRSPK
jgi:DNA (cytosine-5)-methyltransferase 1